ncbi:hypothetical protein [Endozoicomonas sp. ALB032]|uniref:hypothetical protein n=1 Tax=Endozoicomonas sp. ALB032 TaxID=3403082 RepID=UPI003BB7B505
MESFTGVQLFTIWQSVGALVVAGPTVELSDFWHSSASGNGSTAFRGESSLSTFHKVIPRKWLQVSILNDIHQSMSNLLLLLGDEL